MSFILSDPAEAALPKPLLNTPEPMCPSNELACADGTCLNSDLFCDGHSDCVEGSDEGWCGQLAAESQLELTLVADGFFCFIAVCCRSGE